MKERNTNTQVAEEKRTYQSQLYHLEISVKSKNTATHSLITDNSIYIKHKIDRLMEEIRSLMIKHKEEKKL